MSVEPSGDRRGKTSIGADLIIPVAAILFTLYYFSTIIDSPWTAQVSAFFVGSVLLALCVLFVVGVALRVKRGDADLHRDARLSRRRPDGDAGQRLHDRSHGHRRRHRLRHGKHLDHGQQPPTDRR